MIFLFLLDCKVTPTLSIRDESMGPHSLGTQQSKIVLLQHAPSFLSLNRGLLFHCFQRERKNKREERKQRSTDWLPPIHAQTGDQTCNGGLCPDQGSNPQPFRYRMMFQQLSHPARASMCSFFNEVLPGLHRKSDGGRTYMCNPTLAAPSLTGHIHCPRFSLILPSLLLFIKDSITPLPWPYFHHLFAQA